MQYTIYTGLSGRVCDEVKLNGSSHKYTAGQSQDQSLFENGAIRGERICSDKWVVKEESLFLKISSRWLPCDVWVYSFLPRNEVPSLSMPVICPVKKKKPRVSHDYLGKIEL